MKKIQQTTSSMLEITSVDNSTIRLVVRDSNGDSDWGDPGGAQIQTGRSAGSPNITGEYPGQTRPNVRYEGPGVGRPQI